jgi:hypothetical protein
MSVPPRPFGSGNGNHALPYRYPPSLVGTPRVLDSASPGERGDSHSKQGCSTEAPTVEGGFCNWLVARLVPAFQCGQNRKNGRVSKGKGARASKG